MLACGLVQGGPSFDAQATSPGTSPCPTRLEASEIVAGHCGRLPRSGSQPLPKAMWTIGIHFVRFARVKSIDLRGGQAGKEVEARFFSFDRTSALAALLAQSHK